MSKSAQTSKPAQSLKTHQTPNTSNPQTPPIITNKEYRKLKRKLIEIEPENQNQIILIPRAGEKTKDSNWYEMAEHSALIYCWAVCEEIDEKVNFKEDTDSYYEIYPTGLICTNGENKVRLLLQKAQLYKSEHRKNNFYIFELAKKFTKREIDQMLQKELARRKAGNTIIDIEFIDPELFNYLRNAARDLHQICDHFNRLAAQTNGARIVELIDKTLNNYQLMSSINKNHLRFLKTIMQDIRRLALEIQTANHAGIISQKDSVKITANLKPAYEKIQKNYQKALKQESK